MMKKVTKRLWEKKNSKKGFTLVELIVVLVILTILAAITVPALIGYIEKAKQKQVAVEARSAYLAVQTLASAGYAKTPSSRDDVTLDKVLELADLPAASVSKIEVYWSSGSGADTTDKDYYTVVGLRYTAIGGVVFEIGTVTGTADELS